MSRTRTSYGPTATPEPFAAVALATESGRTPPSAGARDSAPPPQRQHTHDAAPTTRPVATYARNLMARFPALDARAARGALRAPPSRRPRASTPKDRP